jgi:amino acid permease
MQERHAPPKAELPSYQTGIPKLPRLNGLSAIGIATFFGGPLAAGYLVYLNFKGLGLPKKAVKAAGWFGIGGLIALYMTWTTPPDFLSFMLAVGLPQLIAVLAVSQVTQGKVIAMHRTAGGAFRSNWFALTVGIAANLLITALLWGLSWSAELIRHPS